MKTRSAAALIVCLAVINVFSQANNELDDNSLPLLKHEASVYKTAGGGAIPYMFYTLLFVNPMLVIEDKKGSFGLTKEVSFGYYPYGRIAMEYSYIFRDMNTSHLRASYNYDIILEAGDFAAFNLTPGAGYFTDTKNKGWFGQLSFGVIIPAFISAVNPYVRYRHTFIQNKAADKTDIDDISIGMGFMFYLND